MSELEGTVNIVHRRRSSLSRSQRPPFSSLVDNMFRRSICRGEFFQIGSLGQSSRGKNPYFWRYQNFLFNTVQDRWKAAHVPKNQRDSQVNTFHTQLYREIYMSVLIIPQCILPVCSSLLRYHTVSVNNQPRTVI